MSYLRAPEQPGILRRPGPSPTSRADQPVVADQPEDTIADLIRRAVTSDVPRLVKLADKIQDLVDQLEADVAEHERGAELRAEAARLEARLAEIRGEIGSKRPTAPVDRPGRDTKAIRAWAARCGLVCPARGRVPRTVIEAFEEAHGMNGQEGSR